MRVVVAHEEAERHRVQELERLAGGDGGRPAQQREAVGQPGPALVLVLAPSGDAQRLTEVLLVQAPHAGIGLLAIVTLDQQELTVCHPMGHRGHGLDPQEPADGGAQALVHHRPIQVGDRGLENVGRGRAALGQPNPAIGVHDDRQLVLGAGQREAILTIVIGVHRPCRQLIEEAHKVAILEPFDILADSPLQLARGQQADGAGGVSAERFEHPEVVIHAHAEIASQQLARSALG